ncbi:DUF4091 domain-containing protein [Desulfovibrio inopinatus]|uniref:DUF4091 domain-containing protein n=1 Tax=Desulfovibrio inopinatus TaxID=102109 RepID=UPI000408A100|nr:DUF4091 domain-containing protein [Desulfovibrio inopinatus]
MRNQHGIRVVWSGVAIVWGMLLLATSVRAADVETFTHRLTQSSSAVVLWTAPPTVRIFKEHTVPTASAESIHLFAARNETEPFQIAVKPSSSGAVTVNVSDFGSGVITELFQVKYVDIEQVSDSLGQTGPYPDPLWPLENGATVQLAGGVNTAFWVSVAVDTTASAGDHIGSVTINGVAVPVVLHVFDFSLPERPSILSQMNTSFQTILSAYSVPGTSTEYWNYVDMVKEFFMAHRLTPKGPLWPGGLTSQGAPFIGYDCAGTFTDTDGIWGFEQPAEKYLGGNGFNNGVGFPSFMAATFKNNDSSQDQRPSSFCGHTLSASDWLGNTDSAYNTAWFAYMEALERYLENLGYLNMAYYYFANEPQDQADYDAIAWYAQEMKKVAPDLRLMVSEEPRPEIYNHPVYTDAAIDIWLPVLNNYDPTVSHARKKQYNEDTWIYFLHGTRPPYFNPITLDHPGLEARFTGWFLWKYRISGLAYYSCNNWNKNPWTNPMTDGHNGDTFLLYPPSEENVAISYGENNHRLVPSIRIELLRDGLEDYEYLKILSGGDPQVDVTNTADSQADKIISGLTSYTRDDDFLANVRKLIGMKIGGEIDTIPDIQPAGSDEKATALYINFQDPNGEPLDDPLVVNGHTYKKVGWDAYDENLGYGWYGNDMEYTMYRYLNDAPNPLQASVIYHDWGRLTTFVHDVPNGEYKVTVSCGWQGRTYSHNKIVIEGIPFLDDEPTAPYVVRTKTVTVSDGTLTMEMGVFDEYTMLNYLEAVPVERGINPALFLLLHDDS